MKYKHIKKTINKKKRVQEHKQGRDPFFFRSNAVFVVKSTNITIYHISSINPTEKCLYMFIYIYVLIFIKRKKYKSSSINKLYN